MASTYSALKIELIATGEQSGTWGTTTNTNLSTALGEAITGSADVSFSSADVTVTLTDTNAAQTARNLRLNLTGTSGGARNLILGSGCQIEKLYLINNGLADTVTVKNTTGTGIAVPAGKSMFVFNNGTNVVDAVNYVAGLATSGANSDITSLSGLTTPLSIAQGGTGTSSTTFTNLTTNVTGTLPIANGGTGSTSTTFVNAATNITGTLPIANGGTGTSSTTFTNLTTNVTGTLPVTNGGTGVATLTTPYGVLAAGTTATGEVQNIGAGTSGQVLVSNGASALPSFQSFSAGLSGLKSQAFTSPGTFTVPSGVTQAKVTVIAGGGGGGGNIIGYGGIFGGVGGAGGLNINYVTGLTPGGTVSVTVGSGGNPSGAGGTSTFGPGGSPATTITATGGGGGNTAGPGAGNPGSGGSGGGYGIVSSGTGTFQGSNVSYFLYGHRGGIQDTTGLVGGGGGRGSAPPNGSPGAAGGGGLVLIEF